jgi:hypothetical protein
MKALKKVIRVYASAVLLSSCVLAVLAGPANAIDGPATLTFQELEKGSTFHFLDNAPEAKLKGGVVSFSPGDVLLFTNPIAMGGKVVGKLRIACTATTAGNTKKPESAGFNCNGIAKIPGGTLVLVAGLGGAVTEGAVTGGTGIYAGARGTFVSTNAKGYSTNTVTLVE